MNIILLFFIVILSGCTTTKEFEEICTNIKIEKLTSQDSIKIVKTHHTAKKQQLSIYYIYNKSLLTKADIKLIENQAKYLKTHPESKAFVTGHADSRGSNKYNLTLGEKRAKNIVSLLISLGVKKSQIELVSYGKTILAIKGITEEAHKYNRRAELFIYTDNSQAKNNENIEFTKQYIFSKKQYDTFYYEFNSSTLASADILFIKNKAADINKNPESKVFIAGYTDLKGSAEYNLSLGQRRAKSIVDLLVKSGVKKSQIESISYGKTNTKIYGNTDETNKYNRRVEMLVYQNTNNTSETITTTTTTSNNRKNNITHINCKYIEISKSQPSIAYGILLLVGIISAAFIL